jgi:hypothetical protein
VRDRRTNAAVMQEQSLVISGCFRATPAEVVTDLGPEWNVRPVRQSKGDVYHGFGDESWD